MIPTVALKGDTYSHPVPHWKEVNVLVQLMGDDIVFSEDGELDSLGRNRTIVTFKLDELRKKIAMLEELNK